MIIKTAQYIISSPDYQKCPAPDRAEFAFIGRSNVGKSSLINLICNQHNLAKTSATPGKTQLINHFAIESAAAVSVPGKRNPVLAWYLVDLPGYGYAKASLRSRRQWGKMIEDYLRKRETLAHVFVLIDSRHKPQPIDLQFVNQLGEWQIPFSLVFTKSDKESQKEVSQHVKAFLQAMLEHWQFLPRHFVTSAVKKTGRRQLLDFIQSFLTEPLP